MKAQHFSALLFILFFSTNSMCQDNQLSEADQHQVFQIKVHKKDGDYIGSAFAVSYEDGVLNLATAAHVIQDYLSIKVYSSKGISYDIVGERENRPLDVGFLSIVYQDSTMPLEAENVSMSDKVSFIRAKNSWEIIQGDHSKAYIQSKQGPYLLIRSLNTLDGDSGGPVYIGNSIAGMISKTGVEGYKEITYLVNMDIIHGVFDDWNIPWQTQLTKIKHEIVTPLPVNSYKKKIALSELKYLSVSKISAGTGCTNGLTNMIDGNTKTSWKCSSHGSTQVDFYFPTKVAIKGFSIYQEGDTNDTNEEIPDGYFKIEDLNIEILLTKLMRNKSLTGSGKWVNYQLKDALITSSFLLDLWTSSVYSSAVYEIKINGYTINNHE